MGFSLQCKRSTILLWETDVASESPPINLFKKVPAFFGLVSPNKVRIAMRKASYIEFVQYANYASSTESDMIMECCVFRKS
jgi:hypothetical protein